MHPCYAVVSRRSRSGGVAVYALTVLLLLIVLPPIVLWAGEEKSDTPTEAVRVALTEVFRILEDPTLKDLPIRPNGAISWRRPLPAGSIMGKCPCAPSALTGAA
jgi:hypothetical protein